MARTIIIGGSQAPEPDVVELFEERFTVRQVTRSVQKALEKAEQHLKALEDTDDSDKAVVVLAEGINVLLAPVEGGRPAGKVIAEKWKDDTLSMSQLTYLYEQIQESAVDRPT